MAAAVAWGQAQLTAAPSGAELLAAGPGRSDPKPGMSLPGGQLDPWPVALELAVEASDFQPWEKEGLPGGGRG